MRFQGIWCECSNIADNIPLGNIQEQFAWTSVDFNCSFLELLIVLRRERKKLILSTWKYFFKYTSILSINITNQYGLNASSQFDSNWLELSFVGATSAFRLEVRRTPHVKIGDTYPTARIVPFQLTLAFFLRIVFTFQCTLLSLHCIFCHHFTTCAIVLCNKREMLKKKVMLLTAHTKRLLKMQSFLVIVAFNACTCSGRSWCETKEE